MEKVHAPAGGTIEGKEDAPFVQEIWEILKADPDGVAVSRTRFACDVLETVNGMVPVWPAKPRLAAEKNATGVPFPFCVTV
jgi:hypothetical protein